MTMWTEGLADFADLADLFGEVLRGGSAKSHFSSAQRLHNVCECAFRIHEVVDKSCGLKIVLQVYAPPRRSAYVCMLPDISSFVLLLSLHSLMELPHKLYGFVALSQQHFSKKTISGIFVHMFVPVLVPISFRAYVLQTCAV